MKKNEGNIEAPNAWQRHRIRHRPAGFEFALADRIRFLNAGHWDAIAAGASVFVSRPYLELLDAAAMSDTEQRYALVYSRGEPVACVATQMHQWRAERLLDQTAAAGSFRRALRDAQRRALQGFDQRLLVCGNLVSSGLHGVGFAPGVEPATVWPGIAEALYRIRRAEKLSGETDFLLVKDFRGEEAGIAVALKPYSYRPVKTEPDMVLDLPQDCDDFEHYLSLLNTKYRGKQKRIRRQIEDAGLTVAPLGDVAAHDAELHALYSEVERRATVRMAALPPGYFGALAQCFGERIRYSVIRDGERIVGFISTIRENDASALAYYVGMNYVMNESAPLYLRLLQCVIEDALGMGCRRISFGRTAAEPKANLGAKPVDMHVWARHRLPAVNWFIRQLFPYLPHEEQPVRSPFKEA